MSFIIGIIYFNLFILHHKLNTMRKTLLTAFIIFALSINAGAQLYKSVLPSTAFTESISKITQDFRNNYYQVQGEQLSADGDMDTYKSLVTVPAAKRCVIYRFHSKVDTTASWQAMMYEGDSYNEAVKIYKNTCRLVDKSNVKLTGGSSVSFSGKINEPDAGIRFVTSSYKLNSKDPAYEKFYAEVELVNINFDQWEVHLNLQSKKDDAEKD